MSDPQRIPDADLDALVRVHLRRRADAVDGQAVLAGVRSRLRNPAPRRRSLLRWGLVAAAAAVLLTLGTGLFLTPPAQASAETLVRQAERAHELPVDRCYLVTLQAEPGLADRFPLLAQSRETHLWTRGDRFWMDSTLAGPAGRRITWGRDDRRRVWLTRARDEGVRFDADETPEALDVTCDMLAMRTPVLLRALLQDFDLSRDESPTTPAGVRVVRAERKPGHDHPTVRAAVLEIDAESKVLQKVVVSREFRGHPLATVTFTLVETGRQTDDKYQLEGHLDENAQIYGRDHQPLKRRGIVTRLLPALGGRLMP